jgi:ABC-2 type transport system ATP-binding protein
MTADAVVRVDGLRKSYGPLHAVRGIDLTIERGEVFALLGPNGAGKTTTVEILEGYRSRDAGDVVVLGTDPAHATDAWRARIGVVLQTTSAFQNLTVVEIVRHVAHFYAAPLDVDEAIGLVGLTDKRNALVRSLSGGQRRRLDVVLGIVGNPEVVFLDEPTTGLDPQARRHAWTLIEQLSGLGTTVLLTTHYLDEAEALASRVAVIADGVIVAEGTPRDIGGRADAAATVSFLASGPLRDRALPEFPGAVIDVDVASGLVQIQTEAPAAMVAALHAWAHTELPALTISRPTLEDVYLRLIAEHASP